MATGQVGYNRPGLQDYCSLHFDSQVALPCFLLFNGSHKCWLEWTLAKSKRKL